MVKVQDLHLMIIYIIQIYIYIYMYIYIKYNITYVYTHTQGRLQDEVERGRWGNLLVLGSAACSMRRDLKQPADPENLGVRGLRA